MNAAFMDRFGARLQFTFMKPDSEARMLHARTGIPTAAAAIMLEYATATRKEADASSLSLGVTTRRLIAWSNAVMAGIPSAKAFLTCVVKGCSPEDREPMLSLEASSLKSRHVEIDTLTHGNADAGDASEDEDASENPSSMGAAFPNDQL